MTTKYASVIGKMKNIAADLMEKKSDFEQYDLPYMENAESTDFPLIWIVKSRSTVMIKVGAGAQEYRDSLRARFYHAQNNFQDNYYLTHHCNGQRVFLITESNVAEISLANAREVVRDVMIPVMEECKAANPNELPKHFKVKLRFHGISLTKLKELIRECDNHEGTSLLSVLKRYRRWTQISHDHTIDFFYDERYNEFGFRELYEGKVGLRGGIIFHGWPETGYMTNNSVQIDPAYGWASHT